MILPICDIHQYSFTLLSDSVTSSANKQSFGIIKVYMILLYIICYVYLLCIYVHMYDLLLRLYIYIYIYIYMYSTVAQPCMYVCTSQYVQCRLQTSYRTQPSITTHNHHFVVPMQQLALALALAVSRQQRQQVLQQWVVLVVVEVEEQKYIEGMQKQKQKYSTQAFLQVPRNVAKPS